MKKVLLGCGTSILVVLVVFALFVCYIVNLFSDNLSKKQIFSLVNKNHELLNECIGSNDFSEIKQLKGVKEVTFENGVLDIYCGGSGFGSATNYYGFYYSPSNKPLVVWCGHISENNSLLPDGKGYSLKKPNDDNWYYTERIRENFFYYESHF